MPSNRANCSEETTVTCVTKVFITKGVCDITLFKSKVVWQRFHNNRCMSRLVRSAADACLAYLCKRAGLRETKDVSCYTMKRQNKFCSSHSYEQSNSCEQLDLADWLLLSSRLETKQQKLAPPSFQALLFTPPNICAKNSTAFSGFPYSLTLKIGHFLCPSVLDIFGSSIDSQYCLEHAIKWNIICRHEYDVLLKYWEGKVVNRISIV